MFDQFLDLVLPFVHDHGYWIVGAILLLENMGIPLPGELVLVSAGLLAIDGHLNPWLIGLWAVIGATVGDNCGYFLGRHYGARLLNAYCRWFKVRRESLEKAQDLFLKYGGWVVFFGRFVALLRIFAGPLAGVMGMTWRRFLTCNALGAIIWVVIILGGSYLFGAHVKDLMNVLGVWGMIAAFVGLFYLKVRITRTLLK